MTYHKKMPVAFKAPGVARVVENKRVVVLLATYNGAKYIREFLDSLLVQSYSDFRLMVRDDGSTDGTLEIVRSYSSRLDIGILESNIRLGPAKSFMELLTQAGENFDIYFLADQDDYWYDFKIARAVERLSGKDVALYCSRLEYVDKKLAHIKYSKIPRRIAFENAVVENIAVGCTMAMTRSARALIVDNLPNRVIMHDWWFYVVVAALGEVIYDETATIKYRQHDNNTIGAATNVLQDMRWRIARFARQDGGMFRPASQADEFIRCYEGMVSDKQLVLLRSLVRAKTHPMLRIKLAIDSVFFRQSWFDTLILKALFLLGKF